MCSTILDAALKVVDDGSENGRQVHHVSALSEAQSKQLVPAGPHQTGVCLLTEEHRKVMSTNKRTLDKQYKII